MAEETAWALYDCEGRYNCWCLFWRRSTISPLSPAPIVLLSMCYVSVSLNWICSGLVCKCFVTFLFLWVHFYKVSSCSSSKTDIIVYLLYLVFHFLDLFTLRANRLGGTSLASAGPPAVPCISSFLMQGSPFSTDVVLKTNPFQFLQCARFVSYFHVFPILFSFSWDWCKSLCQGVAPRVNLELATSVWSVSEW